jgi:hypothetical protein
MVIMRLLRALGVPERNMATKRSTGSEISKFDERSGRFDLLFWSLGYKLVCFDKPSVMRTPMTGSNTTSALVRRHERCGTGDMRRGYLLLAIVTAC